MEEFPQNIEAQKSWPNPGKHGLELKTNQVQFLLSRLAFNSKSFPEEIIRNLFMFSPEQQRKIIVRAIYSADGCPAAEKYIMEHYLSKKSHDNLIPDNEEDLIPINEFNELKKLFGEFLEIQTSKNNFIIPNGHEVPREINIIDLEIGKYCHRHEWLVRLFVLMKTESEFSAKNQIFELFFSTLGSRSADSFQLEQFDLVTGLFISGNLTLKSYLSYLRGLRSAIKEGWLSSSVDEGKFVLQVRTITSRIIALCTNPALAGSEIYKKLVKSLFLNMSRIGQKVDLSDFWIEIKSKNSALYKFLLEDFNRNEMSVSQVSLIARRDPEVAALIKGPNLLFEVPPAEKGDDIKITNLPKKALSFLKSVFRRS